MVSDIGYPTYWISNIGYPTYWISDIQHIRYRISNIYLTFQTHLFFSCFWVVFETTLSQYSSGTTVLSVSLVKFLGKTRVKGQLLQWVSGLTSGNWLSSQTKDKCDPIVQDVKIKITQNAK